MPKTRLLTTPELSALLSVSERTVQDWVYLKRIPYLKVGRAVRFDPNEIDAWIDNQRAS